MMVFVRGEKPYVFLHVDLSNDIEVSQSKPYEEDSKIILKTQRIEDLKPLLRNYQGLAWSRVDIKDPKKEGTSEDLYDYIKSLWVNKLHITANSAGELPMSELLPIEASVEVESRFHEGPKGQKEFQEWMDKQPESVQEDWDKYNEKYSDKFKTASMQGSVQDFIKMLGLQRAQKSSWDPTKTQDYTVLASGVDGRDEFLVELPLTGKIFVYSEDEDGVFAFNSIEALLGFFAEYDRVSWTLKVGGKTAATKGLYGFNKSTQRDVEAQVRKAQKRAASLAKAIFAKDEKTVDFLKAHAKRASSTPAKLLLAAMADLGPKVASKVASAEVPETQKMAALHEEDSFSDRQAAEKVAGGLYGYPTKTARLALNACTEMRAFVGEVAYALHSRREAQYENLTGYMKAHSKQTKCAHTKFLMDCYPEFTRAKTASEEGILEWME